MLKLIAVALLVTLPGIAAAQTSQDEKAVRAAVEQYFKGHATGSADEMRKAFLPTARIEVIRDGQLVSRTVDEFVAGFNGKPAADEHTRQRTINHVELSGTAAMASVTLVHGATTFTDYFVLLKANDQWKIANKAYAARPTK
jgi:hypothetical protein